MAKYDEESNRQASILLAKQRRGKESEQLRRLPPKRWFGKDAEKRKAAYEADLELRIAAAEAKEAAEAKASEKQKLNAPRRFGGRPRSLMEPKQQVLITFLQRHVIWLDAQATRLDVSRAEVLRQLVEAAMTEVQGV